MLHTLALASESAEQVNFGAFRKTLRNDALRTSSRESSNACLHCGCRSGACQADAAGARHARGGTRAGVLRPRPRGVRAQGAQHTNASRHPPKGSRLAVDSLSRHRASGTASRRIRRSSMCGRAHRQSNGSRRCISSSSSRCRLHPSSGCRRSPTKLRRRSPSTMTTMWRCAFPRDWRDVRPPSLRPSLSSPNPALSQTFRDSKSSYQPQISCFTFPPKAVQRGPAQRALGRTRDSAPPAPAQAGPELDAVAGWLQQAAGLSATDAYAALQFLSSDGCRYV